MSHNKLVPTDIWQAQIERPQDIDVALSNIDEIMRILRKKRNNLRALRRICVQVYGEPTIDVESEDDDGAVMFGADGEGDGHDGDGTREAGRVDATVASEILPDEGPGGADPDEGTRKGRRPGRRVPTRFDAPVPE